MIDVPRCEFSDLPLGQCGDRCCRPELVDFEINAQPEVVPGMGAQLDEPVDMRIVRRFTAAHASRCDGCDERIDAGDMIARTADGDYVCSGCAA